MYNKKAMRRKREVITPIPDYMIPLDRFQISSIINFKADDMTYRLDFFSKNKINHLYINEILRTDFPQMLDEYWDERDTPISDGFDFWPDWLFQYYNELPLGEDIESAYLTWKAEQHILTPKYNILCSLVPLVQHFL